MDVQWCCFLVHISMESFSLFIVQWLLMCTELWKASMIPWNYASKNSIIDRPLCIFFRQNNLICSNVTKNSEFVYSLKHLVSNSGIHLFFLKFSLTAWWICSLGLKGVQEKYTALQNCSGYTIRIVFVCSTCSGLIHTIGLKPPWRHIRVLFLERVYQN